MTLGAAASATGSWLSRLRRHLSLPGAGSAAAAEPDPSDSGIDKQALKEVIERKRHHDLVRQREFDHLRQLRRRNLNHASEPAHAPTSHFDTNILAQPEEHGSGERETTLRKIDEIEARLSRQWWRQAAPSMPPGSPAPRGRLPATIPPLPNTTLPAEPEDRLLAATQGAASTLPPPPPVASPPPRAAPRAGPMPPRKPAPASSPLADPSLQEAALRFVNDDLDDAAAILLAALREPATAPRALEALWLGGLLDLYQHNGQTAAAAQAWQTFGARCPRPVWQAPALLDGAALAQLEQAMATAPTPIWLDWHALRAITLEALDPLAHQLAHWCANPLHLRWRGHVRLAQALRALTPPGGQQTRPTAWQARLDALRLLDLRDEFELVALEYCTTFGLAPPQWQEARSRCLLDADTQAAWADAASVELRGDLRDDLGPTLAAWPTDPASTPRLVISCAGLERLGFRATGSLYHWLAAFRAGGGQAQLQEVRPLVAAFLHLCGLAEQAQIVPRQDGE